MSLDRHRSSAALTPRHFTARPVMYFDLASPDTYLAAERAPQLFRGLDWVPASSDAIGQAATPEEHALARRRAAVLGLPMATVVPPDLRVVGGMRVASLAAERGVAAEFVLAASRLVFCGGFNLDDPEILVEAAAVAGIDLGAMLQAVRDVGRDGPIEGTSRRLLARGADRLPVLRVGRTLYCGEQRMAEAAVAARARA